MQKSCSMLSRLSWTKTDARNEYFTNCVDISLESVRRRKKLRNGLLFTIIFGKVNIVYCVKCILCIGEVNISFTVYYNIYVFTLVCDEKYYRSYHYVLYSINIHQKSWKQFYHRNRFCGRASNKTINKKF